MSDREFASDSLECYSCGVEIVHDEWCWNVRKGLNLDGKYTDTGIGVRAVICGECMKRALSDRTVEYQMYTCSRCGHEMPRNEAYTVGGNACPECGCGMTPVARLTPAEAQNHPNFVDDPLPIGSPYHAEEE